MTKSPAKKSAKRAQAARKAPAARKTAPAAAAKKAAPAKTQGPRMSAKNQAIFEAAATGKMPPVPNFKADTHAPYRAKLATLVDLAKRRDVAGLRAVIINPTSTSPKAMLRYRDAAVLALTAPGVVRAKTRR